MVDVASDQSVCRSDVVDRRCRDADELVVDDDNNNDDCCSSITGPDEDGRT